MDSLVREHWIAGSSSLLFGAALLLFFIAAPALAAGTSAGLAVTNQAELRFRLTGASADGVLQARVDTLVDELLDVVVVNDDSGPVLVSSPAQQAILQYSVTNTGNGNEVFRLVANPAVVGDEFDVLNPNLFFETNSLPGLQTGPGGAATPPIPLVPTIRCLRQMQPWWSMRKLTSLVDLTVRT